MKRIATAFFLAATAQAGWLDGGYDDRAAEFCQLKGLRDTPCGSGAACGPKEACLSVGGVEECRELRDKFCPKDGGVGLKDCNPGFIRNPFKDSGCCITKNKLRGGLCKAATLKSGSCTTSDECLGSLKCNDKTGQCE